jgi:hypothetical protein
MQEQLSEDLKGRIQASLDGELSAAAEQQLQAELKSNAQARLFYRQMRQLDEVLASLPPLEPPASLHAGVLGQVELPRPSLWSRWFAAGSGSGLLRYGLSAAAGAVLTLAVVSGERVVPVGDTNGMAGTLSRNGVNGLYQQLDVIPLGNPEVAGELVIARRGEHYVLQVLLDGDGPLNLELGLSDNAGFSAFTPTSGASGSLAYAPGGFSINSDGRASFELQLSAGRQAMLPGTRLSWSFTRQGEVISEGWREPDW